MGINYTAFLHLAQLSRTFCPPGPTLMLGRQKFNLQLDKWSSRRKFIQALKKVGIETLISQFYQKDEYAETMLRELGFEGALSMDASAYEGADIIWDLNTPVSEELRARFGLIVDGGTLEHVFDVSQAMRNVVDMLAPGGRFVCFTPFNGYPGHGFYQFSPELVWTFWNKSCGFIVHDCYIADPNYRFVRQLANTREAGKRIQFSTGFPLSRRIPSRPLLMCYEVEKPLGYAGRNIMQAMQSDYETTWEKAKDN